MEILYTKNDKVTPPLGDSVPKWYNYRMRKIKFTNGEFYHIFNRGVDKRQVFMDDDDLCRFFQSMDEFNTIDPIGSIFENSFRKVENSIFERGEKLVNFICYCLNPNHYHFILEQLVEKGVEKFMHRLGSGYTTYFNQKNKRSGSLFQGKYKAVHIDSNEYLLHVSAYVNLNNKVHKLGDSVPKSKSSWSEYLKSRGNAKDDFCSKEIVLNQFGSIGEYKSFAEDSLKDIQERKEMKKFLVE